MSAIVALTVDVNLMIDAKELLKSLDWAFEKVNNMGAEPRLFMSEHVIDVIRHKTEVGEFEKNLWLPGFKVLVGAMDRVNKTDGAKKHAAMLAQQAMLEGKMVSLERSRWEIEIANARMANMLPVDDPNDKEDTLFCLLASRLAPKMFSGSTPGIITSDIKIQDCLTPWFRNKFHVFPWDKNFQGGK